MLTGVTCCFPIRRRLSVPIGSLPWLFGDICRLHRDYHTRFSSRYTSRLISDRAPSFTPTELAEDPSCPLDLLSVFARNTPEAFCRNPAAPLLVLECPTFFDAVPRESQQIILRIPDAPAPLVHLIAANTLFPDVRLEARLHTLVFGEFADDWQEIVLDTLQWMAGQCSDTEDRSDMLEMTELGLAPEWAAGSPRIPDPLDADEDFQALHERPFACAALHPMMDEYENAGEWQALTEVFPTRGYVNDAESLGLAGAFGWREPEGLDEACPVDDKPIHRQCSPDILRDSSLLLRQVARSGFFEEQWAMAYHPETHPETLLLLAEAPSSLLRRVVNNHPNATDEVRERCRETVLRRPLSGEETDHWHLVRLFLLLTRPEDDPARLAEALWLTNAEGHWAERLIGVLALPEGNDPEGEMAKTLQRMADSECNAIVRAAARARLRGETLRFTA